MKLIKAEENINFLESHFVSVNNKWEMGIFPVLFGYRVGVTRMGHCSYSLNYCAGSDKEFLIELFIAVYRLLELLPEDISINEFENLIPTYQYKPINKDACWPNLKALIKGLEEAKSYRDVKVK